MDWSLKCRFVEGICFNVRVSMEERQFDRISAVVSQFRFESQTHKKGRGMLTTTQSEQLVRTF